MKDPAADKEKAEGSRETIDDEALAASVSRDTRGITNRSVEEEETEQRELPPRGSAKGKGPIEEGSGGQS
jgi:hypothetical protein